MAQFDVVVVGGGHNGLTAACYLAKAGVRVVVLERRRLVGGAAVTEESFPGYQISRASYEPHIEDPIVEELELRKYGYITGQGDPRVFHPFKNGNYLFLHRDPEKTAKEIERFSRDDARAYIKFHKMAKKFGDMFSPLILSPPPSITELVSLIEGSEFDEVIRYFLLMGSEQLVNEFFESEEVKVTFCQISVGNTAMSPSEVGSAYLLAFSESSGGFTYAIGGAGAASKALERAAEALGVTINVNSQVTRITTKDGSITGVELNDGKTISAPVVVSNADPKTTLLKLMEPENFDRDFLTRVKRLRNAGGQTKVNVALKGLPRFKAYSSGSSVGPEHRGGPNFSDSLDDMIQAFYQWRMGEIPDEPPVYNFMQKAYDPSVAPPGRHTISSIVRYTPYHLRHGTWEERLGELKEKFISINEEYAPNMREMIEYIEVLSP